MRIKVFFKVLLLLTSVGGACQTVYHFQYNFHQPDDSIHYHAFFIRYDDGSGLLRIRYLSKDRQDVVAEMDVEEQTVLNDRGMPDSNKVLYSPVNPRMIIGDSKTSVNPPSFLFIYNPKTDFIEPAAVFSSNEKEKTIRNPGTSFIAELINTEGLTKTFVQQFFSEDEDFFVSLFTNKTKGLTPAEKNVRLYLLVVADTLDSEIGSSCSQDMKRIVETFGGLTSYLGIKFFPKTICGKDYNKKNVQTAITTLRPSSNDIVVFYYSGHGFRLPENLRQFPNLKLKNFKNERKNFRDSVTWIRKDRQDNITYSLNIEDIFNSIRKKGARFNLILSDCCNSDIFASNAKGTKPGKTKGSGIEWSEDNVRTLFLNKNPMSILATAAASGQKAASNDNFGGFFSFYFKMAMENYSSKLKNNVNWDLIMQDTQKQTAFKARHTYCEKPYIPENICQQNPDYKVVFGK